MTVEEVKPQENPQDEAELHINPVSAEFKHAGVSKLVIIFLISLLLTGMGVGGFFYYQIFQLNQHVDSTLVSFAHQTKWNQHQISDLQGEYTLLQQKLQQVDQTVQKETQALQTSQGSAALNRGSDYWAIMDAQSFLRLAMTQLLLTNDLPQALGFLTQAQNVLNSLTDPRVAGLKKALEEDVATLKKLSWTNTTNLYQRLVSLQKQIQQLPWLPVPVQNAEKTASSSTADKAADWTSGFAHFWNALKQMVTVYHLPNQNTPPFVTPDLQPYIYQNLYSLLNQAIWAVLNNNPNIYASSLNQASEWIRQYSSGGSTLTMNVLNELQALQGLSIQSSKNVVLTAPKVFQDYWKDNLKGS